MDLLTDSTLILAVIAADVFLAHRSVDRRARSATLAEVSFSVSALVSRRVWRNERGGVLLGALTSSSTKAGNALIIGSAIGLVLAIPGRTLPTIVGTPIALLAGPGSAARSSPRPQNIFLHATRYCVGETLAREVVGGGVDKPDRRVLGV